MTTARTPGERERDLAEKVFLKLFNQPRVTIGEVADMFAVYGQTIRREALKEAAKVCDEYADRRRAGGCRGSGRYLAQEIRALLAKLDDGAGEREG